MKIVKFGAGVFCCMLMTSMAAAQEFQSDKRANHYLDHIVLGINDLDKGIQEFEDRTGIRPRKDGSDSALGTHSAIIGLGDNQFLEIIAPDPDSDPADLDPDLWEHYGGQLKELDELTPFAWAIGTSNLEKTIAFIKHASNHHSELLIGNRKRSWGREENWDWVRITIPESHATPIFLQWSNEEKRPQERAPQGCTLTELHAKSRTYKSVLNLLATMQVNIELSGADEESMQFDLECKGEEVIFEGKTFSDKIIPSPGRN